MSSEGVVWKGEKDGIDNRRWGHSPRLLFPLYLIWWTCCRVRDFRGEAFWYNLTVMKPIEYSCTGEGLASFRAEGLKTVDSIQLGNCV